MMDMTSVSSIGGGAALFPFGESFTSSFRSFYPTPSPSPRSNFIVSPHYGPADMIEKCEETAEKIRQRHSTYYGAFDDVMSIQNGDSRRGALFCRSGTWLEIKDESSIVKKDEKDWRRDTVKGSPVSNTNYGVLDFISVAIGLISIRGVETNRYLCMDREGLLYSTRLSNFSSECVFLEEMMENYFNLYSSCLYGNRRRPWFVALQKDGTPRKAMKTKKRRKASHFLVVHYDDAPSIKEKVQLKELLVPSLKHQPPRHNRIFTENIHTTHRQKSLPSISPPKLKEEKRKQRRRNRERKKKRRREHRLQVQERKRKERREELRRLREMEVERNRELERHRYEASRLSGAGLLIQKITTTNPPPPRLSGAGLYIRTRRLHRR